MKKTPPKDPHGRQEILNGLQNTDRPCHDSTGVHSGILVAGVVLAVTIALVVMYRHMQKRA